MAARDQCRRPSWALKFAGRLEAGSKQAASARWLMLQGNGILLERGCEAQGAQGPGSLECKRPCLKVEGED